MKFLCDIYQFDDIIFFIDLFRCDVITHKGDVRFTGQLDAGKHFPDNITPLCNALTFPTLRTTFFFSIYYTLRTFFFHLFIEPFPRRDATLFFPTVAILRSRAFIVDFAAAWRVKKGVNYIKRNQSARTLAR